MSPSATWLRTLLLKMGSSIRPGHDLSCYPFRTNTFRTIIYLSNILCYQVTTKMSSSDSNYFQKIPSSRYTTGGKSSLTSQLSSTHWYPSGNLAEGRRNKASATVGYSRASSSGGRFAKPYSSSPISSLKKWWGEH